jgi:hypothetical protein
MSVVGVCRGALVASVAALVVATGAAGAPTGVLRTVRVPMPTYHLVGPNGPTDPPITRALTVSAHVFAAQMEWLERAGFHAVSMRQLYDALKVGGKAALPPRRDHL